jgi:type II secretory pathway pseudopilin PulG
MMNKIPIRRRKPSEEGYMLVVVIFMLAILMLSMTAAVPVIKKEIQRDREIETMHRGKQYARAVKLYYKKFGRYPPNLDALVNTNQIRFLRKKYIDPTTGKDEWKIVMVGQQKTVSTGFFGQPIFGAGAPPGSNGLNGLNGSTGGFGSSTGNGIGGMNPSSGGGFNSPGNNSSLFGSSNSSNGAGGTPSSGLFASTPTGSTGSPTDASGGANGTGGTGINGTSTTGSTGQTLGGLGIMGFSPNSPKQSILVYKKKNHYNEWEFLYDPLVDQMMQGGGNMGAIGQPASSTTTPVGSFGNSPSSFGNTSSPSFGGGNTPTPQSPPSQ